MNEDDKILDLDGLWEDDTITIDDSTTYANVVTSYSSPLSTSLTGGFSYFPSPATAISVTGGRGSGGTLTTTSGGSLMWNNPNATVTATASPYTVSTGLNSSNWLGNIHVGDHQAGLRVNGDATFEGDITFKGVSMSDRLDAIEERLGILRPNNDLEGKWEKLKALGDEYRKLEQEILEGEKVWDILKR